RDRARAHGARQRLRARGAARPDAGRGLPARQPGARARHARAAVGCGEASQGAAQVSVTRLARIAEVMRGLAAAREGQRHERLDRRTLEALQRERLTELVRHAVARSPLYADLLRGIDLSRTVDPRDLPIVDKQTLMARFDDWVTDRRLRLADLDAHLAKARGDE